MRSIQRTLHDHVVLAGFGRSGQKALEELLAGGTEADKIAVVDADAEAIEIAKAAGVATIRGDTTRDEVQKAVHIERARSLIVSCGRDDTSILTVLTARHLSRDATIAVAIRNSDNEDLAYQAGANVVINPVSFAGLLLATTHKGRHLAEYLTDLATARGNVRLRERQATEDEVGCLLKDISSGRVLRLYRGEAILGPDDPGPPRVEHGDLILELVAK